MLLLGAAKLYGRPQEVGRKHAHDPNPNRLLPPSTGWNSSPHLKPPDTESGRCGHSVAQSGAVLWVSRVSTQRVVSIFPWGSTGAEFQPPSALVGQPRPPQESLAVCVCPGPDRCLQPNVARHTAGGTEQAVTQRPQAGREGPRHLRTWCKRTQPRTRTHRRAARATCACTAYPRSPHSRQCHSPSRRARSLLPRPSQRLRSQSLKSAPPHI